MEAANATTLTTQQPPDVSHMADIRDIKGLAALPAGSEIWVWAVAVGALLLVGLAAWLLWRRKKNKREQPETPAHETAKARLDELERRPEMGPREFYFQLTGVLRWYLEKRYSFPAMEMTTEELLPRLASLGMPLDLQRGVKELSRRADPVKYAGFPAGPEAMGQDLAFVRQLVAQTRPVMEKVESGQAAVHGGAAADQAGEAAA